MKRKYVVELTDEQRQYLENLITSGISPARKQTRARILLKSDSSGRAPGYDDKWGVFGLTLKVAYATAAASPPSATAVKRR